MVRRFPLILLLVAPVIVASASFVAVASVAPLVRSMTRTRQLASLQRTPAAANESSKEQAKQGSLFTVTSSVPNRDAVIARAAVLRQSILKQQLELQALERQIVCCDNQGANNYNRGHPIEAMVRTATQARNTFRNSFQVLKRKLNRVQKQIGQDNQKYNGKIQHYIGSQMATALRILESLAKNPIKLRQLTVDPRTPTLIPHLPAIYARLDRLENHVDPILEKVLNNRQHLHSVEPYFVEIMERFDDIEPHLPWILKHIDTLAPYTGLLLKHIDELLLYAEGEEGCSEEERYDLAEQILPYLEYYVSRLDLIGPHLPLLRPHMTKLLKHNRIAQITPHIDRLFARGYLNLGTSANLDVLLFWVGWTLHIPFLPRLFFAIPGSPRFVTFLANRLPKRFARGLFCHEVSCSIDSDYGKSWNRLSKD